MNDVLNSFKIKSQALRSRKMFEQVVLFSTNLTNLQPVWVY